MAVMKKVLMHTCCAPCSVYCIDSLRAEGIEPTIFWYNPNIHPYMEYKARRDCLKMYASSIGVKTIFEEEYGLDKFCAAVSGDIAGRCVNYCYPTRIGETARYAAEHGFGLARDGLSIGVPCSRDVGLVSSGYDGSM